MSKGTTTTMWMLMQNWLMRRRGWFRHQLYNIPERFTLIADRNDSDSKLQTLLAMLAYKNALQLIKWTKRHTLTRVGDLAFLCALRAGSVEVLDYLH